MKKKKAKPAARVIHIKYNVDFIDINKATKKLERLVSLAREFKRILSK